MKAILLILVLTSALTMGLYSQQPKDVIILEHSTAYADFPECLNGKIKELHHHSYWAVQKNGQIEKGALLTEKEHQDNSLYYDFQLFFDPAGNLLRSDYIGDNSAVVFSYLNEFRNNKQVKEICVTNNTKVSAEALFNYDENGFLKEILMTWISPDSTGKLAILTDTKGNKTQIKSFDSHNDYTGRADYLWDENNHVVQIISYSAKDQFVNKIELNYNDHGFIKTSKVYDANGKIQFDINGDYTYDNKSNWLTCVWSVSGKPKFLCERTYLYY
jgi:hypothetical protein